MWPYWAMFLMPALVTLFSRRRQASVVTGLHGIKIDAVWWLTIFSYTLLIGFRFEVGPDWFNYLTHLNDVDGQRLLEILTWSDPGYKLVNWISIRVGWDIYGVNLICGAIFCTGLIIFCRSLPRPWLAFTVAIPYLLIVVAMGYTRQGVAIGLAMLGLVALGRQAIPWFMLWVFLAATFHRTAVILFPLAVLVATRYRYWKMFLAGNIVILSYLLFLDRDIDQLYRSYVEQEMQSEGALTRLSMNALAAGILLTRRKRFPMQHADRLLWIWFSALSLLLLALFPLTPASTLLDRIGLYLLPLQLVVFSYLPDILKIKGVHKTMWVVGILAYYASVLFVWLNYASHASAWNPYSFLS